MTSPTQHFPTRSDGLAPSARPPVVELADGERFELVIAPVTKQIAGETVRMLAYNGSIPGPTLKVRQGSHAIINVVNHGDLDATVHWHGLRLDNRYDGTALVQNPIAIGDSFEYRLEFPDAGVYWYHPHIRQDYGQEMGLYGNILVTPADAGYWPPAHREVLLTLDDILIEDGRVAPFKRAHTTYSAMGRFGNDLLIGGQSEISMSAKRGEVVRFYLTNTANTRTFNVTFSGARMKLVGGDSGRCEHEQHIESAVIAPSERLVVDVLFDTDGATLLQHVTPEHTYELGRITVAGEHDDPAPAEVFERLRTNSEMVAERDRIGSHIARRPDKVIALVAEMDFETPDGATVYVCPMHPEIVRDEPGKCPKCAMKLMPRAAEVVYHCPMHPEVVSAQPGKCPKCAMKLMPRAELASDTDARPDVAGAGPGAHEHDTGDHTHAAGAIEWEDDMVDVNRGTNPTNTRWKIIDRETGTAGSGIDWKFRVGDQVKIRLVNELDSDHPMHHPFHIHGAGRFLVLTRDGVVEPNLVWTDTVLVLPGEQLDLLLDVTHPGIWMAHCHIAEHHESGMMFSFEVAAPTAG